MAQIAADIIDQAYQKLQYDLQDTYVKFFGPDDNILNYYHLDSRIDNRIRALFSQIRFATNKRNGEKYCIKSYLLTDASVDQKLSIIFEKRPDLEFWKIVNEITVMSKLTHSSICSLFEVYFDGSFIHLVIDYCSGGELYDLLHRSQYLNEKLALSYTAQLLEALQHMHSYQYVHRAICIENILIEDNDQQRVKLISFYCTGQGQSFKEKYGNPLYMAPEVFLGNYTEKCDIWSLGIVLHTMVTGYQPFQADDMSGIIKKITKAKLPKNTSQWNQLSNGVKELIQIMLSKDNRPSASELLNLPIISSNINRSKKTYTSFLKKGSGIELDPIIIQKQNKANRLRLKIYNALYENNQLSQAAQDLENLFNIIDEDKTGSLSEEKLSKALHEFFNEDDTLQRARILMQKMDINENGLISFDEFMASLHPDLLDYEKIVIAYSYLQKEGKWISSDDLANLTNSPEDIGIWNMVIQEFDSGAKGGLGADDMANFIIKYSS